LKIKHKSVYGNAKGVFHLLYNAGISDEQIASKKELGLPESNVVEEFSVNGGKVKVDYYVGEKLFRTSEVPLDTEIDTKAELLKDTKVRKFLLYFYKTVAYRYF
jgi:hypothetical protein